MGVTLEIAALGPSGAENMHCQSVCSASKSAVSARGDECGLGAGGKQGSGGEVPANYRLQGLKRFDKFRHVVISIKQRGECYTRVVVGF